MKGRYHRNPYTLAYIKGSHASIESPGESIRTSHAGCLINMGTDIGALIGWCGDWCLGLPGSPV